MLRGFMLSLLLLASVPMTVSAQRVGVAARMGSLGFGGEVAVRVIDQVAVRAGIGAFPFEYTGELTDARYTVKPTSPLMNVGVDFYPGYRDVRLGAGMLFIPQSTTLDGAYHGTVLIGGRPYSDAELGAVHGDLDHGSAAPYVLLGLGRQTSRGFGIFFDGGAAFLSEQSLTLESSGAAASDPQFQQDLERERADMEQKIRKYVKVLPILSVGFRYGIR